MRIDIIEWIIIAINLFCFYYIGRKIIYSRIYVRVSVIEDDDMKFNGITYANMLDLKSKEILPRVLIRNVEDQVCRINISYIHNIDYKSKIMYRKVDV